jgi:hypothetical protein
VAVKPLRLSPDLTDFPSTREVNPAIDVLSMAGVDLEGLNTHLITRDGNNIRFQDPATGIVNLIDLKNIISPFARILGNLSTTTTSDTLMTGLTLTPPAGEYLVSHDSSYSHNTNNSEIYVSVYVGGVKQNESEKLFRRGSGAGDVISPLSIVNYKVAVNGSQAIEVRWRTNTGTATSNICRSLNLLKVA